MERTTKAEVEACFRLLCDQVGVRIARSWDDVGGWELDHNSAYGGYMIQEISNSSGGVRTPLGDGRRNARDFCDACRFAVRALEASAEMHRQANVSALVQSVRAQS